MNPEPTPPVANAAGEPLPGIHRWSAFSPHHKVELTSHAVLVDGALWIFDPITLETSARARLLAVAPVRAIVLTNVNHDRSSAEWSRITHAPVIPPAATGDTRPWIVHALDGGAPGETAWRLRERSLVVFGDALFNLPQYGLDVLPEKYCRDRTALRSQLAALCAEPFDTALFAHGTPLLEAASRQLAARLQWSG